MDSISRRRTLALGAGLAASSALPAAAAIPEGNAPPPKLPPEKGASLRVLRPAKFVDPDERIFNANTKKYAEADRRSRSRSTISPGTTCRRRSPS